MNKKQGLAHSLLLCTFFFLASTRVHAQITPDNTLGVESSKLTPNVLVNGANADLINGGALRGNNLFHSFTEFNIKDGQSVYFANPSGVVNILTRVTGSSASNILGTLGVDGGANLFLINPNGILFGKNASLDVRGSFVGTTANGVQFGNQGNFSASEPSAPALLTVNPSALFFNQINPRAAIQNNSVAPAGKDPAGFKAVGLRVPNGESLLLVGGNVSMDGGELNAYGGRVELGGLASNGNINLFFDDNNLRLRFPENITRGTVTLTNQAKVYVGGAGGGDIAVNAQNIEIFGRSGLYAGIAQGSGVPDSTGGNITLNATGEIKITNKSEINNSVRHSSKGNEGNIIINTNSFLLQDSAILFTSTFGQGNTGNVTVTAKNDIEINSPKMTLDNQGKLEANSTSGNGGNIKLNSDLLLLRRGAQISTNAGTNELGGDGSNINIDSRFIVAVPTENSDITANNFTGRGGNVFIRAFSIFGIESRALPSNASDITASSMTGVQGQVSITQPDIELPTNLVDASGAIAQGCTPRNGRTASKFIYTGRGGIPENPYEPLRKRAVITKWVTLPTLPNNESQKTREIFEEVTAKPTPKPIVEAQSWVKNADGSMELVAIAPLHKLKFKIQNSFMSAGKCI